MESLRIISADPTPFSQMDFADFEERRELDPCGFRDTDGLKGSSSESDSSGALP